MSTVPPLPPIGETTLYAAVDGRMASLGVDEAVFFHAGRSQVMTRDVAHAFSLCQAFLPMATHVQRIQDALPALKGQGAAVQRVLQMLVGQGLMQTDTQFIERFATDTEAEQAPVSGIFIAARALTGELQRLLESLAAHAGQFGLPWPVYVIECDADSTSAQDHAQAVAQFVRVSGVKAVHLDHDRIIALIEKLTSALPPQAQALRRLLAPVAGSTGAARNLAALLAAGTRMVFLDADTALPILAHPEAREGAFADPRAIAVRTFDHASNAIAAASEPKTDPLRAHLDVCGLSLAQALGREPRAQLRPENLHGVVPAKAAWLKPQQRVAFTALGCAGRLRPRDPNWVYKLDSNARAGLTATREIYLDNYRAPSAWVGATCFGIGQGHQLLPLAFDCSQLLPCTLPDAPRAAELQIALLRLAHPDSTDLAYPHAVTQLEPRDKASDTLGRPDLARCLAGLADVVAQDVYSTDPALHLSVLAAKLDDLASGSDARLGEYLAEFFAYHRSGAIEQMQRAMAADASPPIYWLADLRAAVEAQGKALIAGEVPRLDGWPEGLDQAACVARFRSALRDFAAGLRAWPAIFDVALARSGEWRAALG
jgi:hypothetical protein